MKISQGLKLRWDLFICRGERGGEGLGGDTAAVATAVCLRLRGHRPESPNHTGCVKSYFKMRSTPFKQASLIFCTFLCIL